MNTVTCPVSQERISENIVQKVAVQVVLLAVIYLVIPNIWIPLFLAYDFAIRSFTSLNISLLGNFAKAWHKRFPPKNSKITDRAPKRFAAGVGLAFNIIIALAFALGIVNTSFIAMGILLICAALEAFLGICVGCYVYTFLSIGNIKIWNTKRL
jgi:hypothetical protein